MPMGDDLVVSSMEITKKSIDILLDLAKALLQQSKNQARSLLSDDSSLKSGKISYKKLKSYSENTKQNLIMQDNISKEDLDTFAKKTKSMNVAYSVFQNGDSYKIAFLEADKAAVNSVFNDIVKERLQAKPDDFIKAQINADEIDSLKEMSKQNNIKADFIADKDGNIFIVNQVKDKLAAEKIRTELSGIKTYVQKNFECSVDGKAEKIQISDLEQNKTLKLGKLPTQAKLERVLQEQFGYGAVKAHEASEKFAQSLTAQQLGYFKANTQQINNLEYFQKDITFKDDNILVKDFSFSRVRFNDDKIDRLMISDGDKSVTLIPDKVSKTDMEKSVRQELGITDSSQLEALVNKAVKCQEQFKQKDTELKKEMHADKSGEYSIERLHENKMQVQFGDVVKRYDMKDRKAAINAMCADFDMSKEKADVVFNKAKRQSPLHNDLHKTQEAQKSAVKKDKPIEKKTNRKGAI